jgi:hypothetical protein
MAGSINDELNRVLSAVQPSGVLLWSDRLAWTHDEDSMEYVDIPALSVGAGNNCLLTIRNSSPTVAVTVNVGHMVKCHPSGAAVDKIWTCAGVAATDVITSAAHGLSAGDAVEIVDAGGGTGVAGTIYYVVGASNSAAHSTAVGANTFCLAAARGSDTVLDITGTGAFTFQIASEFSAITTFTVPVWAAASSTAPVGGVQSVILEAWPFVSGGGRLMVEKAAATSCIMTVYAELRRI